MPAILLHLPAASIYIGLAIAYRRLHGDSSPNQRRWAQAALLVALLLHGAALANDISSPSGPRFGFAAALSMTLWLALVFYWLESFYTRIEGLTALAMPIAAISVLLQLIFPNEHMLPNAGSTAFRLHFIVAMLAYSLFTLAALHALLMAAAERQLHSARMTQAMSSIPPLMTMESLLFKLVGSGFILLTLTVGSGVFFSEALFGKPLAFSHKTVFAIAAWVLFGTLLAGRSLWGWRGRKALHLTLAGFACLLLAYVGTRFVLEVLLGRP
ncbi:cytochrome c biogenesis protein CcsA [Niveibacterium sp. 24ML]|uniref:cytochrome C assembly family protein n=1 Tax=Niveibacterium sp. 24ML TaxID=2985512 RepID=UPI002271954E|nr:cytochrome c biogenesis protein CcsA [Niveibacterium sp. 24ML]MCX9156834.1 cytochrome c biogenesis protein CcsA [Niveibacterium sp. 24ML]